jgi:D-aminopeptidase
LIVSNDFGVGKKVVTAAALPNRVCIVNGWTRIQMMIDDRFAGCHLRIANGYHQLAANVIAVRWSEVV